MTRPLTERYQKRIINDIRELYSDPVEGIFVAPDDDKITILHALIIGPEGTPYEGGFFYFLITFSEKYPLVPPKVKLMTTGDGKVRFNPNLYACGKVCLSILGTWTGPGWTSVMTTKSVLISIQSLMCENPFYNEPGFEKQEARFKKESEEYNKRIHFQRLQVAVCDMVERSLTESAQLTMPQVLKHMVIKLFMKRVDFYEKLCKDNTKMDSQQIKDTFGFTALLGKSTGGSKFDYGGQLSRITALKSKIKMEDNLADDLYESLRTAYKKVTANGEEAPTKEEIDHANELFEPDSDTDPVDLSPYQSSDEDDIQELNFEASTSSGKKAKTDSPDKAINGEYSQVNGDQQERGKTKKTVIEVVEPEIPNKSPKKLIETVDIGDDDSDNDVQLLSE